MKKFGRNGDIVFLEENEILRRRELFKCNFLAKKKNNGDYQVIKDRYYNPDRTFSEEEIVVELLKH